MDRTYAAGGIGVAANLYTNMISVPTRVDATFDNVLFTPMSEPSPIKVRPWS